MPNDERHDWDRLVSQTANAPVDRDREAVSTETVRVVVAEALYCGTHQPTRQPGVIVRDTGGRNWFIPSGQLEPPLDRRAIEPGDAIEIQVELVRFTRMETAVLSAHAPLDAVPKD